MFSAKYANRVHSECYFAIAMKRKSSVFDHNHTLKGLRS